MGDNIHNLPTNEYHIPTNDEIQIVESLFKTPELPTKIFLHNSLYITICVILINSLYFRYLQKIPSHIFLLVSLPLFLALVYYIQIFNHSL